MIMDDGTRIISLSNTLKMIKPPSPYWPESANVYIFKDGDEVSFFDVGCGSRAALERLFHALKLLGWASLPVNQIILSHAHPDHMGAMNGLLSRVTPQAILLHEIDVPYAKDPEKLSLSFDIPLCRENLPIEPHPGSVEGKGSEFHLLSFFRSLGCAMCSITPTRIMREGHWVEIGDYRFRVLHTPGHAPGHVSLVDEGKGLLLAGDILGEVVAWYAPSSGGAEEYLHSLEKVGSLAADLILPAHGDVILNPGKSIQETIQQIVGRENAIMDMLFTGPKTFQEINGQLFSNPSRQFFPGTPIVESHLRRLKNNKKIREVGFHPRTFSLA